MNRFAVGAVFLLEDTRGQRSDRIVVEHRDRHLKNDGTGIQMLVDEAKITPVVIFGGLVGAVLWNLATWVLGLWLAWEGGFLKADQFIAFVAQDLKQKN